MSSRQVVQGVAGAAALIAVLTVLARLAGFGRTLVFTNAVGADSTGDTYLAANNVPNIVFEVVAGGALASLVVPMLAGGIATGDREQVRRTASALLGWSLLVLTPLAVLLALCAEPVARLLLGSGDPLEVELAARFLVVFAPQVVLYGVGRSEEHTSELQSRQYLVCRLLLEKKKLPYSSIPLTLIYFYISYSHSYFLPSL